ncbi:MAG: hypothetical protein IKD37_03990 [Clostridia bacterium]|nr:hypothetical protein [Clostridia bacterium]
MEIKAIVYTSNTGYTAEYAHLLGRRTGVPVLASEEAEATLPKGTAVLYFGWLMAGQIKGYRRAAHRYAVAAVCGVGLGATGGQDASARKANRVPADVPVFTLQGGFDFSRLTGIYRTMMKTFIRVVGGQLEAKTDRTPDEDRVLELLHHGGSCVSEENLAAVLAWLETEEKKNHLS